jgi:hypothetical protein
VSAQVNRQWRVRTRPVGLIRGIQAVEGLENTPRSINKLFDGSHQGKLIVRVSEEPSL